MTSLHDAPRKYKVLARDGAPLIDFMVNALGRARCRFLSCSQADRAPFRLTFEIASGERLGVVAYASPVSAKLTKRGLRYGFRAARDVWHDPEGLFVTLLVGIDTDLGLFVGADPSLHRALGKSIELGRPHVDAIMKRGFHAWEREQSAREQSDGEPVDVLVGGTADNLLRYVLFEQAALGQDRGHRHLIADRLSPQGASNQRAVSSSAGKYDSNISS